MDDFSKFSDNQELMAAAAVNSQVDVDSSIDIDPSGAIEAK